MGVWKERYFVVSNDGKVYCNNDCTNCSIDTHVWVAHSIWFCLSLSVVPFNKTGLVPSKSCVMKLKNPEVKKNFKMRVTNRSISEKIDKENALHFIELIHYIFKCQLNYDIFCIWVDKVIIFMWWIDNILIMFKCDW